MGFLFCTDHHQRHDQASELSWERTKLVLLFQHALCQVCQCQNTCVLFNDDHLCTFTCRYELKLGNVDSIFTLYAHTEFQEAMSPRLLKAWDLYRGIMCCSITLHIVSLSMKSRLVTQSCCSMLSVRPLLQSVDRLPLTPCQKHYRARVKRVMYSMVNACSIWITILVNGGSSGAAVVARSRRSDQGSQKFLPTSGDTVWQIEKFSECFSGKWVSYHHPFITVINYDHHHHILGAQLQYNDKCRVKHMLTRKYLAVIHDEKSQQHNVRHFVYWCSTLLVFVLEHLKTCKTHVLGWSL